MSFSLKLALCCVVGSLFIGEFFGKSFFETYALASFTFTHSIVFYSFLAKGE